MSKYTTWCNAETIDDDTKAELRAIADDPKEIEDRFYKDLEFGTGGMRGVMGAGTNRINKYTAGRAAAGFGKFLTDVYTAERCAFDGAIIAYDTRCGSRELAEVTADILTGLGIRVYVFNTPVPTPQLSYTIRQFGCLGGVVITASHNPKEYNGFKVYDRLGGQACPNYAKEVIKRINEITDYKSIQFEGNAELKHYVYNTDNFVDDVIAQTPKTTAENEKRLKVVYTALHGTGNIPVKTALIKRGFELKTVAEQAIPDGNFPTVVSPNPEVRASMDMAISLGLETDADIVLGTDPDCDRVGVGVRTADGFELLTGNQIGILLTDYILNKKDVSKIHKPAVCKTAVSSELGADIAKKHGVAVFTTLTGFKYIGERMNQFEKARREGDSLRDYTFVFGYEESFGCLGGDYARDKDGVGVCLLVCEMAAEYKSRGVTLLDRLNEIYAEYGYCLDAQDNFTLKGKDGTERIRDIMASLRENGMPFETESVADYSRPVKAEPNFGELPTSNVLKFTFADGSWIAARPSGTEPKIKFYYSIKAADKTAAEKRLKEYGDALKKKYDL